MRTLCILLWRNLMVTKRKPISFLFHLLFPLVYLVLLHMIKDKLIPNALRLDDDKFIKHTVEKFPALTSPLPRCLLYTPNSKLAGMLMDEVGRQLGLSMLTSVPDPDEEAFEPCLGYYPFTNYYEIANLVTKFHSNEAVILFEDMDAETWSSRRQDTLTYTIRMKRNFSTHVIISNEDIVPKDHPDYGDIYEGFTRIQWAIDTSYIKIRSGNDVPQKLSLQEFPYYRQSVETATKAALVAILLYFVYVADLLVSFQHVFIRMMSDRAEGIQEMIKLNDVSVVTLGASYFISTLPPVMLFVVASTIVLKMGDPSIIQNTSGAILLIGLILYAVSIIACGMACSYLAHTSQYAGALAIFMYLATVLIASYVKGKSSFKPLVMATGLVLHIPLDWVLMDIASFEAIGKPLTFGEIFKSHSTTRCSVLFAYSSLMMQSVIFFMITFYLSYVRQGKFGNSKPWNICLKKGFWTGRRTSVNAAYSKTDVVDSGREEKYFETPPKNMEVGISIINVTKSYPKHDALSNLTLDVFKGEITILLGHNGAGKTTLMSIITGMISATKGVVYVNGVDSRSHIFKNIGLCPQHNLFLPHFNVLEHVMFFHMLKSKSTVKEARTKSIELLDQLGLGNKTSSSPGDLSGGMKRRLQLACALTGGSEVLVLDEPTSGLDVQTRRELWNLVLSLRGGHTVLLSTHFMEEADALGDRVAALHTGHLRCHATPMFLKKAMGSGYRLSITTTGAPKESEITRVITHHVSDATVKEKTAKSITYNLPSSATSKFPALFAALEKDTQKRKCCILPPKGKRGVLGIATIGLGVTTLEEAFLTLCSDTDMVNEDEMDCTDTAGQRSLLSGKPLYKRQLVALLKRHFSYVKANWFFIFICNALIPWLLMYWFLGATNSSDDDKMSEPDLVVDLTMYHSLPERRVLLNVNTTRKVSRRLMHKYGDVMFSESRNIKDDIIAISKSNIVGYNNYLIGVELDDRHAKALYSTVHRHAAPAAVNLLSNAIASHYLAQPKSGNRLITVHNHPLNDVTIGNWQLAQATPPPSQVKGAIQCCYWAIIVAWMISLINCNYIILPSREGASGMRHIHVMAGCPAVLHWLTTLAVHVTMVAAIMIPAVIFYAYYVDKDNTIAQPVLLIYVVIIIILGTTAFLGLLYVLSMCFTEKAAGVIGGMFTIGFGLMVPLIQVGADVLREKLNIFLKIGLWITSVLMPAQTMTLAMSKAVYIGRLNALCKVNKENCPDIMVEESPGFNKDKCCAGETTPYFAFNQYSPGNEILIMIAQGIVYMLIVIKIQEGYFNRLYDRVVNANFRADVPSDQDELVSDESKYVASEITMDKSTIKEDDEALLVSDLHKNFRSCMKRVYAVRGVSFSVKRGECFGLLGTNGAGKSTTFKMLSAEVYPTRGIVYANQYFLHEDKYEFLRTIGYCPQFFGIDEFQTGSENIRTVLAIRGLDDDVINEELEAWLDVTGLKRYKNTVASAYSGGYKRRLAAAVALCSGAPLSLLDEPTAGVDVGARRRVHSAFKKSLCQKRSIVITSHSMDEMESLCERIAIMVDGKIRALGTPAELRYRFAQGYAVILKITPNRGDRGRSTDDKVEHLKDTMEKKFDCQLKDEHMTMLHYHLSDNISYSDLFQQLEQIRNSYVKLIEDYSVSETTLEEVFLLLANEDKEEVESQDDISAECGMLSCIGNKIGARKRGLRNCDPCDLKL